MLWRYETIQLSVVLPSVAVLNVVAPIGSQVNNFQVFLFITFKSQRLHFQAIHFLPVARFNSGKWQALFLFALILHFLVKISSLWDL